MPEIPSPHLSGPTGVSLKKKGAETTLKTILSSMISSGRVSMPQVPAGEFTLLAKKVPVQVHKEHMSERLSAATDVIHESSNP